jgi:hypothetical protein
MNNVIKTLAVIALVAIPTVFYALPPDPPAGGGPPCGGPFGAVCPIDGGVSFLIAAGLAMGGKKAYDMTRKKA